MDCSFCGGENPAEARYCMLCGNRFPTATAPHRRKVASFLFCDIVGSTALADEVDVEVVRALTFGYFATVRGVIERHGGHVEKYIGDAVFGGFGVSTTREDDALRAVRAAVEIQQRITDLNERFDADYGRRIELRIGVNTDKLVVGDITKDEPLVAGDAANVAARLQTAADPGTILIGENTFRLVRAWVRADPIAPIVAKGKSSPVPAYVVRSVADAPSVTRGRLPTSFVGRDDDLGSLRSLFETCRRHDDWRYVLVTGEAGIGKTRLVAEFTDGLGDEATVLTGRCRQPGDGPIYGPLIELVSQLGAAEGAAPAAERLQRRVREIVGDDREEADEIARVLNAAIELTDRPVPIAETAWAARRLLESLAAAGPVVLVVEDMHWAERQLVEMLDQLLSRFAAVPMLIVGVARPDRVPTLAAVDDQRTQTIGLSPLDRQDTSAVIGHAVGSALPADVVARIASTADGNPLYIEELLSMLLDDGALYEVDGVWRGTSDPVELSVPVGIEALLHARLDRLSELPRAVLERAALLGSDFSLAALVELAGELPEVGDAGLDRAVDELVERDLLVRDRAGDGHLSFRHVLIRSVAYGRNTKRLRADLHQRLADWLERRHERRTNAADEVIGYHLEQAVALRTELFQAGDVEAALSLKAGQRLESAGAGLLASNDLGGAIGLLQRASKQYTPPDLSRVECLLGSVLGEAGELREGIQLLAVSIAEAEARSDTEVATAATVERLIIEMQLDPDRVAAEFRGAAADWHRSIEAAGQPAPEARLWHLDALIHWHYVHCEQAAASWARSAAAAERAGDARRLADALSWQASTAFYGPMPAPEAIGLCRQTIDRLGDDRLARSQVRLSLACLEAMTGNEEVAAELVAESDATVASIGPHVMAAACHREAFVAALRGDWADAERRLAAGIEQLEAIGERALLSTNAALLAHALLAQGRDEEAMQMTVVSSEAAADDDIATQVAWRTARAKLLAASGAVVEAEALGRHAVALAERTDCLVDHADAVRDLAQVVGRAGRESQRRSLLAEASKLYLRKGHTVGLEQCRQHAKSPLGAN